MKKRENLSAVSLLTLFLILGSLSIWSGVAVAQVWNTEIVDSGKDVPDQYDVGMYNSIALDSSGILHISYGGNGYFRYATNGSDSWLINTISRRLVGYYTSLVIDSSGNSHISLYDHFTDSLKYATNSSGTWVIQTVDSDGNAGRYSSIALDSSGKVHISYCGGLYSNSDLKYATNASGAWVTQTLDRGKVGWYTSIALDSSNKVHVSYLDWLNQDLKYATNAAGTWVIKTLDSRGATGGYSSIATDSLDNVHISYVNGSLMYATNELGRWTIETLDSGSRASDTSLAVDAYGNVHISYSTYRSDITYRNLKYITNATGTWVKETVISSENARHTSIALDSLGKVHISYWDYLNRDLKHATNTDLSFADDSNLENEEDVIDIIDGNDPPADDPPVDDPITIDPDTEHIDGVADGDYIHFGGRDWIMLDNLTGYAILKDYAGTKKIAFDAGGGQTWDYNGKTASSKLYLNTIFFDSLGDDKDFIDNNGEWVIEAGVNDPEYTWNGKVGMLTKTEFEYYNENGPNLTGTSVRAISFPIEDPNFFGQWWLLTPAVGYAGGDSTVRFIADYNRISATDSRATHQGFIRPTLHLKSGLYVKNGDGTSENPKIITDDPNQNEPPMADSGPSQTVELASSDGTEVTLDGSESTDIDSSPETNDDIVDFDWYKDDILLGSGESFVYTFPLGTHTVKLIVTDSAGESDEDEVVITIEDTTPPEVAISASPETLWPPNGKMKNVLIQGEATDISGEVSLVLLVEDEYGEINLSLSDFDEIIQLEAWRKGRDKDGRTYTINVIATDSSGNGAFASTLVVVPHDQGKKK